MYEEFHVGYLWTIRIKDETGALHSDVWLAEDPYEAIGSAQAFYKGGTLRSIYRGEEITNLSKVKIDKHGRVMGF